MAICLMAGDPKLRAGLASPIATKSCLYLSSLPTTKNIAFFFPDKRLILLFPHSAFQRLWSVLPPRAPCLYVYSLYTLFFTHKLTACPRIIQMDGCTWLIEDVRCINRLKRAVAGELTAGQT